MNTRTREDLVLEALEKLGICPAGQTPNVEDAARVDEALDSIIDELAALEITYAPDLNNIPSAWFMSLASIVAQGCMDKFGIVGDEAQTLGTKRDEAVLKLKVMMRGRPTGEPMQTSYF